MIHGGQWPDLVRTLLTDHYDPSYSKSANYPKATESVDLAEMNGSALGRAAEVILKG